MTDTTLGWSAFDFTLQYDADHRFPFIEDENGNITGYGHQDPVAFARAITDYDRLASGDPTFDATFPDDVSHTWGKSDPDDDERIVPCEGTDAGAHPLTTVWGLR